MIPPNGAIDCDIHPSIPNLKALLPYLEEHWREMVLLRGMDELNSISFPLAAPDAARADWRPATGKPGASLAQIQSQALDPFGTALAICTCLYGVQLLHSEDLAAAFSRAVNDWMVATLLSQDSRLRGTIVIPTQNPDMAVDEIERCAANPAFVQVLMLAGADTPLGKRHLWPIYKACERNNLVLGIHAGNTYHNPPTAVGWPSLYIEENVAQAQGFQTQLTSLVCEGVLSRHPNLKVVLLESGFTWVPAHMWRLTKYWRGLRMEIPWVDRSPDEILRDNIRFSLQPIDAPPTTADLERVFDHLQSDRLILFSTDYPHARFDGTEAMPDGLSPALIRRIAIDNPLETYARLAETVA
jgi:predicted TIM-barrel fold metal-dependent hydrolase